MTCKRCGSIQLGSISGKSADKNCGTLLGERFEGYVPYDCGIGGGDYIRFHWCLKCGQIQGDWPIDLLNEDR